MLSSEQLWQTLRCFPATLVRELPHLVVQLGVYLSVMILLLDWGAHQILTIVATLVALVATAVLVPWQVRSLAAVESSRRAQARGPYRPGSASWVWALLLASMWIWFWVEHPLATAVIFVALRLMSLLSTRRSRETSKGWG